MTHGPQLTNSLLRRDEQIERSIELIQEMLAQREAGANAKVIEGEAEASLPAPTAPKRAS